MRLNIKNEPCHFIFLLFLFFFSPFSAVVAGAQSPVDTLVISGSSDLLQQNTKSSFSRYNRAAVISRDSLMTYKLDDINTIIIDGSSADTWKDPAFIDFLQDDFYRNFLLNFAYKGGRVAISISYQSVDHGSSFLKTLKTWGNNQTSVAEVIFDPFSFEIGIGERNQKIFWNSYNISKAYKEKLKEISGPGGFSLNFLEISDDWDVIGITEAKKPVALAAAHGKGSIILLLEDLSTRIDSQKPMYKERQDLAVSLIMDYASGNLTQKNDVVYLRGRDVIKGFVLSVDKEEIRISTEDEIKKIPRKSVEKIVFDMISY